MKALNQIECLNWLTTHGLLTSHYEHPSSLFSEMPIPNLPYLRFSLPKDSGRKVALARTLLFQFGATSDVLLWLRNWMVWPSSGHVPLALRLREALGCKLSLDEAPGHLFASNEREDALSILVIALEFVWDCFLTNSELQLFCFVSHDEYLILMGKSNELLEQISQILEKSGFCHRL